MARVIVDESITRVAPDTPRVGEFDVVVPTIGRPSLATLLAALDRAPGPQPRAIVIADDRPDPASPLRLPELANLRPAVVEVGGRGPAAARNAGWRGCTAPWVVFLDDDVVPTPTWWQDLDADLDDVDRRVAAVQGRITVPLDGRRRPTDYERNVAGLESADWITADLAVRRAALLDVGGFDARFRRAYREDTDLALRLSAAGWQLARGQRRALHPVGPSTWRTSITAQRGNADDALMRRLHGRSWRRRGRAPEGALTSHVATSALALGSAVAAARHHRRAALVVAGVAIGRIVGFWVRRCAPGPRRPSEWARMLPSSVVIPFAAPAWRLIGAVRARRLAPGGSADVLTATVPALVLFDRDGTLVHDVAYNGDPEKVVPVPGAAEALERLRSAGIAVGIITNQSGVGRGWLDLDQVAAVNARVEELLGPFDVTEVCPHAESDGCACRKPAPGMVLRAADSLGVAPVRVAVVGDIASDVAAATAAGGRGVLVPNGATAPDEIVTAPEVAATLSDAVDLLLDGRHPSRRESVA